MSENTISNLNDQDLKTYIYSSNELTSSYKLSSDSNTQSETESFKRPYEETTVDEEKNNKIIKLEKNVQNGNNEKNKQNKNSVTLNHDPEAKRLHMDCKFISMEKVSKEYLYKYMYVEKYENGGGYILHAYQNEIANLEPNDIELFVNRYFKCLFRETQCNNSTLPYSLYCIGIIHGSARKIPELLSYMTEKYSNLIVKSNIMEFKNDIQTLTMSEYSQNVINNYKNGLYRYGPLHSVSLVGKKGEETGGYFKDVLRHMEKNPFLKMVMPWGPLTKLYGTPPDESDDGPILWMRHGEQAVPSYQSKKKSRNSPGGLNAVGVPVSLMGLPISGRGGVAPRQTLVLDRTPCHADHADDGLERHTTAAVGVLKAVHAPGSRPHPRVVKDAVCFDPRHYHDLIQRLKLDIMEPPASQCGNYWADDAELNQLRMEGFRYVRVWLRDNDIYFIPRNVVHQFKTVSAVASVAWHARLRRYYQPTSSSASAASTPDKSASKTPATQAPDTPAPATEAPAPPIADMEEVIIANNTPAPSIPQPGVPTNPVPNTQPLPAPDQVNP